MMNFPENGIKLRIYIGESDTWHGENINKLMPFIEEMLIQGMVTQAMVNVKLYRGN